MSVSAITNRRLGFFPSGRFSFVVLLVITFVISFGIILDQIVLDYAKASKRGFCLQFIDTVSPYLDPAIISELTGDAADPLKPQYMQAKKYLVDLRAANPDYRFAYLMGKRGNNIVFLVDAEDENSPDYSPPGTVYREASEQLHQIFNDGKSFIEGPIVDSYGEWFSIHAPIFSNGSIVAIVGIDVSAKVWQKAINDYHLFAAAITLLVALIVLVSQLAIRKISKEREHARQVNRELKDALTQVKTLEGIIPICSYCKHVRTDEKSWQRLEEYISLHTNADFSHGICPDCAAERFPDVYKELRTRK